MKTKAVFSVLLVLALSGCATSMMKGRSSGEIGCDEDQIEISNVSNSLSGKTWTATCNGHKFFCSLHMVGVSGDTHCKEAIAPVKASSL